MAGQPESRPASVSTSGAAAAPVERSAPRAGPRRAGVRRPSQYGRYGRWTGGEPIRRHRSGRRDAAGRPGCRPRAAVRSRRGPGAGRPRRSAQPQSRPAGSGLLVTGRGGLVAVGTVPLDLAVHHRGLLRLAVATWAVVPIRSTSPRLEPRRPAPGQNTVLARSDGVDGTMGGDHHRASGRGGASRHPSPVSPANDPGGRPARRRAAAAVPDGPAAAPWPAPAASRPARRPASGPATPPG